MERFREQEKVFKMKEYSIKGLQQTKRQTDEEDSEGSKEEEAREEL